jgi:hypothetical protein
LAGDQGRGRTNGRFAAHLVEAGGRSLISTWQQLVVGLPWKIPHDHLLLDSVPNIGPLISRWELDEFKICWNKSSRPSKILTLLYQQFSNLFISQRDMSGPRLGTLSNNRWLGGTSCTQDFTLLFLNRDSFSSYRDGSHAEPWETITRTFRLFWSFLAFESFNILPIGFWIANRTSFWLSASHGGCSNSFFITVKTSKRFQIDEDGSQSEDVTHTSDWSMSFVIRTIYWPWTLLGKFRCSFRRIIRKNLKKICI